MTDYRASIVEDERAMRQSAEVLRLYALGETSVPNRILDDAAAILSSLLGNPGCDEYLHARQELASMTVEALGKNKPHYALEEEIRRGLVAINTVYRTIEYPDGDERKEGFANRLLIASDFCDEYSRQAYARWLR